MVSEKSAGAYRTIGELSAETGVARHILRYWETRFPQLRPLTRAGRRRYYRPDDVAMVRRIHDLLERDGYTIRGVQALLASERTDAAMVDPRAIERVRNALIDALQSDESHHDD